jgi:uncharacterized alpha-E superfamily protein
MVHTMGGFEAMMELFDSTITFHAQYQQSRDMAALIDLLVLDPDNPRSLAWVTQTLRGRLAKLAGSQAGQLCPLSLRLPDPALWDLSKLCEASPDYVAQPLPPEVPRSQGAQMPAFPENSYFFTLSDLLLKCTTASVNVSDAISTSYFTHSGEINRSVGT